MFEIDAESLICASGNDKIVVYDRFVNRMNNPYQVVWGNETLTLSEDNIRIVKYKK